MEYFDQKAEDWLLGSILWKNKQPLREILWLTKDDFWFDEHRLIWDVILGLYKNDQLVDIQTVWDETRKKLARKSFPPAENQGYPLDEKFVSDLLDCVEGLNYIPKGIMALACRIRELAIMRKLSEGEIDLEEAEKLRAEIPKEQKTEIIDLSDGLADRIDEFARGDHLKNMGYKTSYNKLDTRIEGLKKKDLIVISGRPSAGKTTFALNMAINIAEQYKIRVLYVNLEMSGKQLINKIISLKAKISGQKMRNEIGEYDAKKMLYLGERISDFPMTIVDKGTIGMDELCRLIEGGEYGLLVIDQLLKIKRNKRERLDQEIADITLGLKEMAKTFDIPIVLLHQANRKIEGRTDKRPMLSDLRDSGSIEQDADIVLFVHRDAIYTGDTEDIHALIRVAKNKMGEVGDVQMRFYGEYSEFCEEAIL